MAGAANEVTEFKGTLKSVRGVMMTVTRDDGTDVLVQLPDDPSSLTLVAKAMPAYLKRGMLVRFDTVIGPSGQPTQPVSKLVVFAPINLNSLPGHRRDPFQPGIHPKDRNQRGKSRFMGPATVVGNLMMVTPQGGLALQIGKQPFQTMVAPDAKIELQINNLSLAKPGDSVKVAGFYQPPVDTRVKGDRITVMPDRVYGEVTAGAARGARNKKPEEAAEIKAN
ncbi:MAG: hypothetical protein AAF745_05500 [Planctomycetota bacterium]